jgi:hypothetical protein
VTEGSQRLAPTGAGIETQGPVAVAEAQAPVVQAPVAQDRAARAHTRPRAPADGNTSALEEARLIGELDAALRSGDGMRALRLTDEHARRFPHGTLADERDGGRVLARCMSGSGASGADAFLAAHPRSPMRARIVSACGNGKAGLQP